MSRYRSKLISSIGRINRTDSSCNNYVGSTILNNTNYCIDEVHTPPFLAESDLTLFKWGGNTQRVTSHWKRTPTGCKESHAWNVTRQAIYPGYTEPDYMIVPWQGAVNEALGKVQDSAPEVDVPLLVGELKDLPRTLRSTFKNVLQKSKALKATPISRLGAAARQYKADDLWLTYQFGIKPLINDIKQLFDLQKSLANRVKQHRKKYRTRRAGGTLSQRPVHTKAGQQDNQYRTTCGYWYLYSDITWSLTSKMWYSARLTPQIPLSETLANVMDNPLGIGDPSLETLWNLMPWSFLVDYFADVADVLHVNGNKQPYNVDSICIMCSFEHTMRSRHIPPSDSRVISYSVKEGNEIFSYKLRKVFNYPTAMLAFTPFLSGSQVANIAALASTFKR